MIICTAVTLLELVPVLAVLMEEFMIILMHSSVFFIISKGFLRRLMLKVIWCHEKHQSASRNLNSRPNWKYSVWGCRLRLQSTNKQLSTQNPERIKNALDENFGKWKMNEIEYKRCAMFYKSWNMSENGF
ncbi:hypothetical protein GCK72_022877 [Caenorhabditis remanei]|uniref:Uncharacterized protein n=1 Tax=Caenorhabditis remanei TaxID=31234 RepID=A0A6A5FV34_CAERE|nr:hypothetical protein GCK72_022877 [Caenorhabditis remanei]KAF1746422.1 hypothetical protein GCK72_022877 [Caenorhabditis remanei]